VMLTPDAGTTYGPAEVRLVDGAGHMAHMEKPHDVVAAVEATEGNSQ
jgi:pimeloyl-ACP methyl ester carboxylesterase